MILWALLIDPGEAAERRVAWKRRAQQRRQPSLAGHTGSSGTAGGASPRRGHNRPVPPPQPDWRQTACGIALRLAWFALRRFMRAWVAHSLEHRHALSLSTLSYRRIRAHHVGRARLRLMSRRSFENEKIVMAQAFRHANSDLEHHLAFVRGRHPKTFRALAGRPVRIATADELRLIEKRFPHYLA
jgi:hypothetical protein